MKTLKVKFIIMLINNNDQQCLNLIDIIIISQRNINLIDIIIVVTT